ncbi:MAG: cyclophane-containing peptide 2OG-Fe(II) oxygenase YhhC [Pseudomonadota bacterium]
MHQLEIDKFQDLPFQHIQFSKIFTDEYALKLLDWLEKCVNWKLKITDFYQQFECNLTSCIVPKDIQYFREKFFLESLAHTIEKLFHTKVGIDINISATKMIEGQFVEIHNDYLSSESSHRLVIYLNEGWVGEQGGELVIFNSYDPGDIHEIILPSHNTAFAFKISEKSLHEVKSIISGQRFSLVYTFYEKAKQFDK